MNQNHPPADARSTRQRQVDAMFGVVHDLVGDVAMLAQRLRTAEERIERLQQQPPEGRP